MKIHKWGKIKWTYTCGKIYKAGCHDEIHQTWKGVTCKACLKLKPKPKVHYANSLAYVTECNLDIEDYYIKYTDRWSKVTCKNCRKAGGRKV